MGRSTSTLTTAERRWVETVESGLRPSAAKRLSTSWMTGSREFVPRAPELVLVHDRVAARRFADGTVVERLDAADRAEGGDRQRQKDA
jgi:hypothetical protein